MNAYQTIVKHIASTTSFNHISLEDIRFFVKKHHQKELSYLKQGQKNLSYTTWCKITADARADAIEKEMALYDKQVGIK